MRLIANDALDVKSDIKYVVDCVHGLVYVIRSAANARLRKHTHTHTSSLATTYHYRCHGATSAAGRTSPDEPPAHTPGGPNAKFPSPVLRKHTHTHTHKTIHYILQPQLLTRPFHSLECMSDFYPKYLYFGAVSFISLCYHFDTS